MPYQIIVCGGLAPDPLQTLEPIATPQGPALKNEAMLPHIFDPWAAHALYESAHLARQSPGSTIQVISVAPKAKLQQVMMMLAQKLPFQLIPVDAPNNGFTDAIAIVDVLAHTIQGMPHLDRENLMLCGGWESATRGAGVVMGMLAGRLGITEIFMAVDEIQIEAGGTLLVKERVEGGKHCQSRLVRLPAAFSWATGTLPEPPNSVQIGMQNMKTIMPAIQKCANTPLQNRGMDGLVHEEVSLPKVLRETKVVKDVPASAIAREIVEWIQA